MAAPGRPTKYTPATKKRIHEALSKGCTHKLAAAAGGISEDTFCEWQNTLPEFSELVAKAEAEAAQRWLDLIEQAAQDGNWQAAAWKLERRYPDMYGRREQVRQIVSGPDGDSLRVQVEFVASIALAAIAARPTGDSGDTSDDGHRLLSDGSALGQVHVRAGA